MDQNYKQRKLSRNKGFTLTEVLVVVAITMILLAFSFVAANVYRKHLKITELDNAAKEIFMAAQNRAVLLKNRDSLSSLVRKDGGANKITGVDMGDGGDGSIQVDVYYMKSVDVNIAELLPQGTIDPALREGEFCIIYEAESGSVADVFYAEESWVDNVDFPTWYLQYRRTSRSIRMDLNPMVGYYGGDAAQSGSSIALRTPVINIYNEDTLKAEITWWIPKSLYSEADRIKMKVTLEYEGEKIVLSDEKYSERVEETSVNGSAYRTLTAAYLLDSLEERMQFKDLFDNSNLEMGKNFKITAEVSYDDTGAGDTKTKVNGAKKTAEDNSLFAKGYGEETSGGETAYIEYTRHLQNLREEFSQKNSQKSGKTAAVQIADITCPEGYSFQPINADKLNQYDGRKFQIRSLMVNTPEIGAGLFGEVKGQTPAAPFVFQDIYLVNASVTGSAENSYVGALAGGVQNAVVSGCRSYWELDSGESGNLRYLLTKDGEILYKVQGNYAGGLAGILDNCVVTDSMASSTVEGISYAGGLTGKGSNVTFKKSYADCYLTGENAAGLAGELVGSSNSMDTCYAAGFILGESNKAGAGLSLGSAGASVDNTYSAMAYQQGRVNYPLCLAGGTYGSFVYYLESSYLTGGIESEKAVTYKNLTDPVWCSQKFPEGFESKRVSVTHPYNLQEELSLSRYPYPGIIGRDHYGDWTAQFRSGSLVYMEEYPGSPEAAAYGFQGANVSFLQDTPPVWDGYAVAFDETEVQGDVQLGVTVTYHYEDEEGNAQERAVTYKLSESGSADGDTMSLVKIEKDGKPYYLAPLPDDLVNTQTASSNFYQKIRYTIGGRETSYYYNPHFAAAVLEYEEELDLAEQARNLQVRVRTPRHLNELSKHPEYCASYNNYIYLQELDLDYDFYTGYGLNEKIQEKGQDSIGKNSALPFRCIYDGGCHVIKNLPVTASGNYVGLFGYSSGIIRDTVFLCDEENETKLTRSSSRSGVIYAGGLAGYNRGTIENSAVAGVSLQIHAYENSTAYVGGLAGVNYGTIIGSEAALKRISADATYSSVYAGGFTGLNASGGRISKCYATGRVEADRSRVGTVYASGFAAGNQAAIRDCYCAADLRVSGGAEKFGFCKDHTNNCYYLNEGNFTYDGQVFSAQYDDRGAAIPQKWEDLAENSVTAGKLGTAPGAKVYQGFGEEDSYPYPGMVKDAQGAFIHYGDWPTPMELGIVGVCYWEKEVTYVDHAKVNEAYHFSAVSVNTDTGSVSKKTTLCTEHDDGGVIEEYGYGYFYTGEKPGFAHPFTTMLDGAGNGAAAEKLMELMGQKYHFELYTTARAGDQKEGEVGGNIAYTFLAREYHKASQIGIVYDTWTLTLGTDQKYSFYVNPFFGDSIAYAVPDGATVTVEDDVPRSAPGHTEEIPFGVRSVEQLEFINWNLDEGDLNGNGKERDVNTVLRTGNCLMYPYLSYYYTSSMHEERKYFWKQSHDLDGQGHTQTPIAEFNDPTNDGNGVGFLNGWFSGTFDGDDYVIANVNIQGQSSSCAGLFGIVYNGTLKNIIMYSEDGRAWIKSRDYDSGSRWFAMGALAGLAASSSSGSAVQNCSVAGYTLYDSHKMIQSGWGGSGIGGLLGLSNMNLTGCSAVTNIEVTSEAYETDNMRIGGLVGACQKSMSNCYAGGEIKFAGTINHMEDGRVTRHAYIGGIVGGIYMKCLKAGPDTIGGDRNQYLTNSLENCYSFVTLPKADQYIRGLYAVGGSGEILKEYNAPVNCPVKLDNSGETTYRNCYYLKETVLSNNDGKYPEKNTPWDLNDESEVQPISYQEMADGTLLKKLNDAGAQFSTVTTRAADGNSIDGKYSYATDNILTGLNYPFPTILTREDSVNGTVNIHYGNWPLSGIQREHGNLPVNIDVFADYEKYAQDGRSSYAQDKAVERETISLSRILKAMSSNGTLTVSCANAEAFEEGEGNGTGEKPEEQPAADAFFLQGDELVKEITLVNGKLDGEDPVLIIEGLREGSAEATIHYTPAETTTGVQIADLKIQVNVTAELHLLPAREITEDQNPDGSEEGQKTMEPLDEAVCFADNSVLIELYAFDLEGNALPWKLQEKIRTTVDRKVIGMDTEYVRDAFCEEVLEEDGITKVPCRADLHVAARTKTGSTSVIVEYEYTYNDKAYQASGTVNLAVRQMELVAKAAEIFLDESSRITYDKSQITATATDEYGIEETIDLSNMIFLSAGSTTNLYVNPSADGSQVIMDGLAEGEEIAFLTLSFPYGGGTHTAEAEAEITVYASRLHLEGESLKGGTLSYDVGTMQEASLTAQLMDSQHTEYQWELSGDISPYLTVENASSGTTKTMEIPEYSAETWEAEEVFQSDEVVTEMEESVETEAALPEAENAILTEEAFETTADPGQQANGAAAGAGQLTLRLKLVDTEGTKDAIKIHGGAIQGMLTVTAVGETEGGGTITVTRSIPVILYDSTADPITVLQNGQEVLSDGGEVQFQESQSPDDSSPDAGTGMVIHVPEDHFLTEDGSFVDFGTEGEG